MKNEKMTSEELEDRLLDFAVRIGNVADALPETPLGQHIADQILRSGTSPAPNYSEGCAVESRRDFAHKLNISLKELRETGMRIRGIQAYLLPAQHPRNATDMTNPQVR